MNYSVFEVFRIGIGPSSSHTVGPMLAVNRFMTTLEHQHYLSQTTRIQIHLYGSLALTGIGHGTDGAVLAGLTGALPESVDPLAIGALIESIKNSGRVTLMGQHEIAFDAATDLMFHRHHSLPQHSNGIVLQAYSAAGELLYQNTYFSIGGGAVLDIDEIVSSTALKTTKPAPHAFGNAEELLLMGNQQNLSIAEMMWQNELQYFDAVTLRAKLLQVWKVMHDCVERGLKAEGTLPGGLNVKRRAHRIYQQASTVGGKLSSDFQAMDMVSAFAIAVNEENACGGRVVTAPTNGSAGVIPAVLSYFIRFCQQMRSQKEIEDNIIKFLLTAAGIGMLYKKNASISAAEMGCQGEIGVSCSMAAGGLAAVLGANNEQIENAAEIAMEHNLGMSCDPIGGLVQIPCIERNSMGAVKAINAARLAMMHEGGHIVSLDAVIETMRQTGVDMQSKYKETALGGLAINVVAC
ncbi:MAG: L-serine ammonia-lyase [Methylophilales bacterium]|nr:L-serine ammonia-lyase [Methylophilales bacterium]